MPHWAKDNGNLQQSEVSLVQVKPGTPLPSGQNARVHSFDHHELSPVLNAGRSTTSQSCLMEAKAISGDSRGQRVLEQRPVEYCSRAEGLPGQESQSWIIHKSLYQRLRDE